MIKKVTLETAIQLKNAGFIQDSISKFYVNRKDQRGRDNWNIEDLYTFPRDKVKEYYAAPTSDEILEELPETIHIKGVETWWLTIEKCNGVYVCFYDGYEDKSYQENESLPEAPAKMYLWLKAEGLIGGDK